MPVQSKMAGHCVRCHQDFTEPDGCIVPHVFDEESCYNGGQEEYVYNSVCCGEDETVTEVGAGNEHFQMDDVEPCFDGYHTISADEVDYNGINFVPCKLNEEGECVRLWLDEEEGLIFQWHVEKIRKEEVECNKNDSNNA